MGPFTSRSTVCQDFKVQWPPHPWPNTGFSLQFGSAASSLYISSEPIAQRFWQCDWPYRSTLVHASYHKGGSGWLIYPLAHTFQKEFDQVQNASAYIKKRTIPKIASTRNLNCSARNLPNSHDSASRIHFLTQLHPFSGHCTLLCTRNATKRIDHQVLNTMGDFCTTVQRLTLLWQRQRTGGHEKKE